MSNFERYQCWHQERVVEVINKEAISVDLADFMATHAPLEQIATLRSGATMSEASLLDELVRASQGDLHTFAVIQGAPGTGKSHLIRWLYQRYLADGGGQDEVLLIERAQNSLLGTLRQIVEKIDIQSDALRQQLDKLRGAAASLSEKAIQDTILNNLQIATYEHEVSPKNKIRHGIERFLLDPVIRDFLKAEGGPVERIAKFLTTGRRADQDIGDRPEFLAEDFDLRADTLHAVKAQGYAEARELAEALSLKLNLREDLASYLNRLLDYAISRTVVLSADDLKQTFNDLRRELRRRGRGLALFIEDITAFTGIDLGLIDVLATQHTGEGNRDFCRVISVVGITDGYYNDRFPPNMQERISHHLTLSGAGSMQPNAGLLHSPQAAAALSARYLNAMRAEQSQVRVWFDDGARIERVPNRCAECPFREPCHAAFGSVNIGAPGEQPVEVGLYPFNAQAIWNIYTYLDSTSIARTPRSLLNEVLLDVLKTHGRRVSAGTFPPPPGNLAAGVRDVPALAKPVQQRVISEQGGSDAARVHSLVVFWGNGTIDTVGDGAGRTVGGLSDVVFHAFAVRAIVGLPHNAPPLLPSSERTYVAPSSVATASQQTASARKGTKYDADIAKWRGGGILDEFESLRRLLVNFVKSAIDWTIYGISSDVVDERIQPRRFKIEGQSGRVIGEHLVLPRSEELADTLQALAELDEHDGNVEQGALGAHLARLGSWLRHNEEMIVGYARQPTGDQSVPMRLVELLLVDCLLLEWLCDKLRVDGATPPELLKVVLKGAGAEYGSKPLSDQEWASHIQAAGETHSRAWVDLMRSIRMARAKTCRSQLLKQLNQPQGSSSDIRFLDAATALDLLAAIRERDWAFRPILEVDDRASSTWKDAGAVYTLFAARLSDVLESERLYQQHLLDRLQDLTGDSSPDEVLKAVENLLGSLKEHGRPHSLGDLPTKAQGMKNMLQYLRASIAEPRRGALAVRLSAGARTMETAHALKGYFESMVKLAEKVIEEQGSQIAQLQSASDAQIIEDQTLALYDETIALLRGPLVAEEETRS